MKFYIFLLLIFFSFSIFSAGYWLPIYGPRDMARGGAFMVKGDDLTVIAHNPAALTNFSGIHVYSSVAAINTRGSIDYYNRPFENDINNDPTDYDFPVKNIPDVFFNPNLIGSYDFGLKNWNFSFGVYGPYAPDYNYDKKCRVRNGADKSQPSCPNRYSLYESDIIMVNPQITAAWKPIKNLSIGVGFKLTYINFKYSLDLINAGGVLGTFLDDEARAGRSDAKLDFNATDPINPNFILGISYKLNKYLTFALSYQSPIEVEAEGEGDTEIYPTSEILINVETKIVGKDLKIKLNIPHVIRFGVLFEMGDDFNIEFGARYETWSMHDKVVIDPYGIHAEMSLSEDPIPLQTVVQKKNWNDTFSLHLGGDIYFLDKRFALTIGGFYEKGAIPAEYYDASIVDTDKFGASIGVMNKWRWSTFYASFSYINFLQMDVINSKVFPGNAMEPDYPSDFLVGNGRYKTDMFILAVGVQAAF